MAVRATPMDEAYKAVDRRKVMRHTLGLASGSRSVSAWCCEPV